MVAGTFAPMRLECGAVDGVGSFMMFDVANDFRENGMVSVG